ncbi:MAG: YbbC/YhhH family protein [Bacteroidota bacterium]
MKYLLILLTISISACSQNNQTELGESNAKKELKFALSQESQHNALDSKSVIIKDRLTAIQVAEPILFGIYGKDNIESQKPYECYLIENYWIIGGALPKDMLGGTFLIIIDARNSKVLKITHGK